MSKHHDLEQACIAMFQAFTRHPSNEEEKHHALTLAEKAIPEKYRIVTTEE